MRKFQTQIPLPFWDATQFRRKSQQQERGAIGNKYSALENHQISRYSRGV
jgi:hypothetical protein